MTVSQTLLVFEDFLTALSSDQVFYRLSLNLGLSDVFLMIRLGLQFFWEEDTEVTCHPHYTRVHDITDDINL